MGRSYHKKFQLHATRPKVDPSSLSSVTKSSYNLPQSPKLSSGALLEKYGAGVGSGIPTHSTSSSLLGYGSGGSGGGGVKKSMSFSNFGSVRGAGAENALQVRREFYPSYHATFFYQILHSCVKCLFLSAFYLLCVLGVS